MYKVMIVDDEPLVRLALHHIICWQEMNMIIACESSDGAEALRILINRDDIDILLLDIQMPKMTGIELLRNLQTVPLRRKPIAIMLSAFNDYTLVREAFLLGALDYIVKTDMDEEHILPILQKATEALKRQGAVNETDAMHQYEKLKKDQNRVIHEFVANESTYDENYYTALVTKICTWLGEINQVVAVFSIEDGLLKMTKSVSETTVEKFITQTIHTVFESMSFKSMLYNMESNYYVLLFTFPQYRSEATIREQINLTLSVIKTRLEQYINVLVAIGISDVANGREQWRPLVKQARFLVSMSYFDGFDKLYFPEYKTVRVAENINEIRNELREKGTEIGQLLVHDQSLLWELEFDCFAKLLKEHITIDPQEARSILADFLWELGYQLYRKEIRWEQLFDRSLNPFEYLKNLQTLEASFNWLKQTCINIYNLTHEQNLKVNQRYSHIVLKAKKFIDGHFCEDLNLHLISELVGVSENHISKQFTKEVGYNFIQYLTRLRIEESKRLLRMGFKINEVSDKIGYLNSEHFSRIFKKVTGYSPKAFREMS